jgi:hypothetical protein
MPLVSGVESIMSLSGVVSKAESDRVERHALQCIAAGQMPIPRCCEWCESADVAGLGLWVPCRELQVEFWGRKPPGQMPGFGVYAVCHACYADPAVQDLIEDKFVRQMRRGKRPVRQYALK